MRTMSSNFTRLRPVTCQRPVLAHALLLEQHRPSRSQLDGGCNQQQQHAAEKESTGAGDALYKLTNDRRITPIGSFLRRTSLDELPQIFNVLSGEMLLVGPRPAIQYELAAY